MVVLFSYRLLRSFNAYKYPTRTAMMRIDTTTEVAAAMTVTLLLSLVSFDFPVMSAECD